MTISQIQPDDSHEMMSHDVEVEEKDTTGDKSMETEGVELIHKGTGTEGDQDFNSQYLIWKPLLWLDLLHQLMSCLKQKIMAKSG